MNLKELFERNAKLVVFLGIMCSSFSAIFTRILSEEMSPLIIGFYRLSFSLPFFFYLALSNKETRQELKDLKAQNISLSMMAGVFLFFHFLCWFNAVARTSIVNASVLCAMHPVIIAFLCVAILKEKITLPMLMAVTLSLIGAIFLAGGDLRLIGGEYFIGDILAFTASICLSLYWIIGRKARNNLSANVHILITFSSCWLCFLLASLMTGSKFAGYSLMAFFWVFLMALTCQILGHATMNWGLGFVSPMFISVVDNTSAVYAAVLGAIFFKEYPALFQYIGGISAVSGLVLYNYFENKRNNELT